jgi:Ser/Thr protein kinase RdoA (MazF antagonist)
MSELPPSVTDLESIRSNQRFSTFSANYEDERVFVKQLHSAELKKALRAEVWGMETFTQLAQVQKFPFEIPKVVLSGEDFLVTSWVAGELMDLQPGGRDFDDDIEFLASSYAALDQAMALFRPMRTSWVYDRNGKSVLDNLVERMKPLNYADFFSEELVSDGLGYIDNNLPKLEARLTHADFTPSNVMRDGSHKTLIDFESVSLLWPRFYDVVNMTINRQVLEPDLSAGMVKLFNSFVEQAETDTTAYLHQLNTIAMVRAISLIIECIGQPDTLHNTQHSMTPEIADRLQQVINRILDGQLYIL